MTEYIFYAEKLFMQYKFYFLKLSQERLMQSKIRMRECQNNQIYAGKKSKINVPVQ